MSHSLIGADRRSHIKVLAVAAGGAMSLILLGIAAQRSETAFATTHAQAERPVIKAGTPVLTASVGAATIR
jgi:hypothetical protein